MAESVFITGASGGIGRACAEQLSKDGFRVAACYSSGRESAEELKESINSSGGYCEIYRLDFTADNPAEVFRKAENDFGGFYAVVNCAGAALTKLFTDTTDEEFERITAINFKGVYEICKAAVPCMVRRKEGKIINISSIWGSNGASCEVLYCATKAAVEGLTRALAKELAPSNIQVNCVAPGVIDTRMNDNLTADEKQALRDEIPACRFGKSEEVAKAVSFLAGKDSGYITAQVITVDGGYT